MAATASVVPNPERKRSSKSLYLRIYQAIRTIPPGKVSSYGHIAEAAGLPGQARLVGYALHSLPAGSDVPWHRVVNHRGRISLNETYGAGGLQRVLLEGEGVDFNTNDQLDMEIFGFDFGKVS